MATATVRLGRASSLPERRDLALAAAAAAAGQFVVWAKWGTEPFYGSRAYNAVLSVLLLGALAWWRRAPVPAVLWYVTLFCGAQAIVPHDLPAWTGYFPLVLLVAAAGRMAPLRPALVALVVALAGFALLGLLEPSLHSADTLVFDTLVRRGPRPWKPTWPRWPRHRRTVSAQRSHESARAWPESFTTSLPTR
jgi:hypothetical protein